jgi:formylglycine-generating enzyme required for sulfatase activity
VGSYSPAGDSPCGCADVAGNVWEWTAGQLGPGSEDRVLRGGAFYNAAWFVRCAYRYWGDPYSRLMGCGFRLVAALSHL